MSVKGGQGKLKQGQKDLMTAWYRVRESWQDDNRRQMEKNLIEPIVRDMHAVQLAMEQMGLLLSRIHSECT